MSTDASPSNSPAQVTGALILIQVLFGVNYAVSKGIVGLFPPLVWASLRIAIATLAILGVTLALKRPHPRAGAKFFVPLIGLALLGTILNQSAFLVGLKYTTATNSAVLNSLIPVFTLLVVTVRGQERLTGKRALGFGLALLGVFVLRRVENMSWSDETWIGDLLTMFNCLSYALFLSLGRTFTQTYDRLWTTTWLFAYGTVGITLLALPDWLNFTFPKIEPAMWGSLAFSVFGATLLTYFLNIWTLARAKSSQVAVYIYLQPVVGAAFAWFWLSEVPTVRTVVSSSLIFLGMLLALEGNAPRWLKRWTGGVR
jgi:drug/metabolite transporter (DMT)-like permease